MKKSFILLLFIFSIFSFFSCGNGDSDSSDAPVLPVSSNFTISIKNEAKAAFFIAVKKNGATKSEFLSVPLNQNETKKYEFEKGTVINAVEFYSGINIQTMTQKLQKSYNSTITSNTNLVIRGKDTFTVETLN